MADNARISELLRRFDLPPLPKIAHTLIQMLGDPDVSVHDLAGVISVEPALASRLIRVANSSMYAQTRQVTTVERAAVILGLGYVKALCLANQLAAPLSKLRIPQSDAEAFWRDSLLRACVGRQLARACRDVDAEHAFLVGLLMDIAIPTLLESEGPAYAEEYARLRAYQVELDAWERANLGFTHAELGGALLKSWKMPEVLTAAITLHHTNPAAAESNAAGGLHKVSYFAGALPLGASVPSDGPQATRAAMGPVIESLGLTAETVAQSLHRSRNESETIAGMFETLLPESCDVAGVLVEACECMAQTEPALFRAAYSATQPV